MHVALERFVFAVVPLLPRLLRDPRPMPDHPLDQIVRQADAPSHPSRSASQVNGGERPREGDPDDEQDVMGGAALPRGGEIPTVGKSSRQESMEDSISSRW